MQRIEFNNGCSQDLFCPFCGIKSVCEGGIEQCQHLLYVATDDSFEYVNKSLGFDVSVDLGGNNIDEFTSKLDIDEAVKFALYDPAPSFYGAYVGFVATGCKENQEPT